MKKIKRYLYEKCKLYVLRNARRYDEGFNNVKIILYGVPSEMSRNRVFNEIVNNKDNNEKIIMIDPKSEYENYKKGIRKERRGGKR